MTPVTNLLADLPAALDAEWVTTLLQGDVVRIERIVSTGHSSPEGFWYDQPDDEWVLVLCGSARLRFEDEESLKALTAGDHVFIPAHRRHRVEWTVPDEPTVWLAVHIRSRGQ